MYVTKNKATSVNVFTNLETHGFKRGANNTVLTPGGTFTTEWGVGQVLPLKKDFSKLLQLGDVGIRSVAGFGQSRPRSPMV